MAPLLASLSLSAGACASPPSSGTPAPTQAGPSTQIPSPIPSAEPQLVFLTGRVADPLQAPLSEWANGKGWQLTPLAVEQMGGSWVSDPNVRAAVGYESDGFPPVGAVGRAWPAVVLEASTTTPGGRIHIVGTPGERRDEAAFLVGVLAGLVSRTGWIGVIHSTGGPHAAVDEAGFQAGIRYSCPICRVLTWAPGEITTDALRANTIDVLYALPGPAAADGLAPAAGVDLWQVWLETLPGAIPADHVAGGIAFDLRGPTLRALEAVAGGEGGAAWPYSAALEGLALVNPNSAALLLGHRRIFDEAWRGLADGSLTIGIDPLTGEEP
ncbi:MAG: BMP family ABC transporter substrate-binding protein [Anaerolineales bacterium]